jgi:hypothetical protein
MASNLLLNILRGLIRHYGSAVQLRFCPKRDSLSRQGMAKKEYLHRDHTVAPNVAWLGPLDLRRHAEEEIVWRDARYAPRLSADFRLRLVVALVGLRPCEVATRFPVSARTIYRWL